jgi:hypothetical protein
VGGRWRYGGECYHGVIVRLRFANSGVTASDPKGFWVEYGRQSDKTISPEEAEDKIKSDFKSRIEDYINRETPRRKSFISIDLIAIKYSSLDLILSVLGIDSETYRAFVLDAIAVYSPIALNESVGGRAALISEIVSPVEMTKEESSMNRLGVVATSLLVPIILALLVWYVTFNALTDERKEVRAEAQAAKLEQSEFLKMIADQNTKLSALLVEASKSSAVNATELEQLQLNIIRLRAIALGLLPPDAAIPAMTPSPTTKHSGKGNPN